MEAISLHKALHNTEMSKKNNKSFLEEELDETPKYSPEPTAFADWFSVRLKENSKLRAHHYDSILAFFKDNKLTDKEPEESFDKMLRQFGY